MNNYLLNNDLWLDVLSDLKERNPWQRAKIKEYTKILSNNEHRIIASSLLDDTYTFSIPQKVEINKIGSKKKKTIYLFNFRDDFTLKVLNRILIDKYSNLISPACHSFQAKKGAKTAFKSLLKDKSLNEKFCLKTDISNFFNSINTIDFFNSLPIEIRSNKFILSILKQVILSRKCLYKNKIIYENKGLMAGTAIAPFLSNLYLKSIDEHFVKSNVTYARYSDDIILFDNKNAVNKHFNYLKNELNIRKLVLNEQKTNIFSPGEKWTFLGFTYSNGIIDISENSVNKLKGKVKRLSKRYNRKYVSGRFSKHETLSYFIKKLNNKFYGKSTKIDTLCWSKWYFPLINTSTTLKRVDNYIQNKLRYSVTGRYCKLNYKKVPYSLLKSLEYKPLNSTFHLFKYDYEKFNKLIHKLQ